MSRELEWLPVLEGELKAAYQAPGRAYHNWDHITYLLDEFRRLTTHWRRPMTVETAVYWHDVIYVPTSATNEADSAAMMERRLQGRADPKLVADERDLVLATASHDVPADMDAELAQDCALFLDMDMSILGGAPDLFDAYDVAIREEFSVIPDETYRPRRAEVLAGFLAREHLFLTEIYQRSHNMQARDNLGRAIIRLS